MIDDEPEFSSPHAEALEDEGYLVTRVKDVDEAINIVSRKEFDIIIMDLLMPPPREERSKLQADLRQTGVNLHYTLRVKLEVSCPIVIMSVVRDEKIWSEIIRVERDCGVEKIKFMKKPTRPSEIVSSVKKLLR